LSHDEFDGCIYPIELPKISNQSEFTKKAASGAHTNTKEKIMSDSLPNCTRKTIRNRSDVSTAAITSTTFTHSSDERNNSNRNIRDYNTIIQQIQSLEEALKQFSNSLQNNCHYNNTMISTADSCAIAATTMTTTTNHNNINCCNSSNNSSSSSSSNSSSNNNNSSSSSSNNSSSNNGSGSDNNNDASPTIPTILSSSSNNDNLCTETEIHKSLNTFLLRLQHAIQTTCTTV